MSQAQRWTLLWCIASPGCRSLCALLCWGCLGEAPVAGSAAPAEHCNIMAEELMAEGKQHFHRGGDQHYMLGAWPPPTHTHTITSTLTFIYAIMAAFKRLVCSFKTGQHHNRFGGTSAWDSSNHNRDQWNHFQRGGKKVEMSCFESIIIELQLCGRFWIR